MSTLNHFSNPFSKPVCAYSRWVSFFRSSIPRRSNYQLKSQACAQTKAMCASLYVISIDNCELSTHVECAASCSETKTSNVLRAKLSTNESFSQNSEFSSPCSKWQNISNSRSSFPHVLFQESVFFTTDASGQINCCNVKKLKIPKPTGFL